MTLPRIAARGGRAGPGVQVEIGTVRLFFQRGHTLGHWRVGGRSQPVDMADDTGSGGLGWGR